MRSPVRFRVPWTARLLRQRRAILPVALAAGVLIPGAPVLAGNCIDDLSARSNNCTANDVGIVRLALLSVLDGCAFVGDTATVELQATLEATASLRYDIGIFVARDGGAARTGSCHHDYLPPPLALSGGEDPGSGVGPYLEAEDDPTAGDQCGDIEQAVPTLRNLPPFTILCRDDDGDGNVDPLGYCVSWDNQVDINCFGLAETLPGTPAKCHCGTAPLDPELPSGGCSSDAQCADPLFCNGSEVCVAGKCQPGTPPDCQDGDPCTLDTCSESARACTHVCETVPPVLDGIPPSTVVECDAVPPPATPTARDNCDPAPAIGFSQRRVEGSCPDRYTLIRTWTATDRCGNSTSASQTIVVQDTTPPRFSGIPPDLTVECDAVPPPATPAVTDNCDPDPRVEFQETRIPGLCPGDYTLLRRWTATDRCGNSATAVQRIRVIDTTGPVILDPPSIGGGCAFLWPPQHGYVRFSIEDTGISAADACGAVRFEMSACASSQPEDNHGDQNARDGGDGHSACDCAIAPDRQAVALRAERNGACRPLDRSYAIGIEAIDECGNRTPALPFGICVYHDRGHRPPDTGPIFSASPSSHQNDDLCAEGWINGSYPAASSKRGTRVCGGGCSLACDPTQRQP